MHNKNQKIEDSFSTLITNSPFGVILVDQDFNLKMLSRGAARVFSNIDPLIGRDFAEILRIIWPEPFASEAIEHYRHTMATGETYESPSTVEQRNNIDAIESYDWRIERLTLPDGNPGVVCHFYDLSERYQWEAALQESEESLTTIIDNVPLGIAVIDSHGVFQSINPAGLQLLECRTRKEIPRDFDSCSKALEAYDAKGRLMPLKEWPPYRAIQGHFVKNFEMQLRLKGDGMTKYTVWTTRPMKETESDRILLVMQDMTQRHSSEQTLRETEHNLKLVANPILPVSKGVILLPLIGSIDSKRSRQLEKDVLKNIQKLRARVLVMDVTGAGNIDRPAAEALIRMIKAARLQGAKTIVSGISQELADHLVQLNIYMDTVHTTTGSLESGLQIAHELVAHHQPVLERENGTTGAAMTQRKL